MNPICDYHIHTALCGHATGEIGEYIETAIQMGFREIGFADHAPFIPHELPGITMSIDQLPGYHKMLEDAREKYRSQIDIKIGIEADFLPGCEDKTRSLLAGYPYDFVIGSVHFLKDWGFDNPDTRAVWNQKDTDEVYCEYYDYLRRSAQSGLFDILAHVDLVKKFGHRPSKDLKEEVQKNAEVFKGSGVVIEINPSGLRKPAREIYPSLWSLEIYQRNGVPITFGSDAHNPEDVGRSFDEAVELAKTAGYKEYVVFKDRKIAEKVKL